MKIAIEPTEEQINILKNRFKSLFYKEWYKDYPNPYFDIHRNQIMFTRRTKHDDDFWSKHSSNYSRYFDWVDFETFEKKNVFNN